MADPRFAEGESWKTGSSVKRANMEAFVEWLLTPESEREHRTRGAFAEWLGVTTQTLRNYEKDPFVVSSLSARRRAAFKVAKVDDVIHSLYLQATDTENARSVAASKILLDWAEKQTAEVNAEALRELSDDELKAMLVEMFDKI